MFTLWCFHYLIREVKDWNLFNGERGKAYFILLLGNFAGCLRVKIGEMKMQIFWLQASHRKFPSTARKYFNFSLRITVCVLENIISVIRSSKKRTTNGELKIKINSTDILCGDVNDIRCCWRGGKKFLGIVGPSCSSETCLARRECFPSELGIKEVMSWGFLYYLHGRKLLAIKMRTLDKHVTSLEGDGEKPREKLKIVASLISLWFFLT